MQNLFTYKDFHNEAKKEKSAVDFFKEDVKNLLEDMFAKVKKPTYKYDSEGFPTNIEFEIEKSDYEIDYDELSNEFSEGVLAKRDFIPVLVFVNKEEKEEGNGYEIEFKIKKEKAEKAKKEKVEKNRFEKDSDEQLLSKLKSKKTSDIDKEKIMDELKDRGVDYKDPFEDDEDDYDIEKESDKNFGKKKSKKNESIDDKIAYGYKLYGYNSEFSDELDEMLGNNVEDKDIEKFLEDWDVSESATKEYFHDEIEKGMRDEFVDDSETRDYDYIGQLMDDMGYGEIMHTQHIEEFENSEFYIPEMTDDEYANALNLFISYGGDGNMMGDEDADRIEQNRLYDQMAESVNEGFMGKVAKFLSKTEYEKTLKHVLDCCEEDCDLGEVKDCLKNMVFSKITKQALKDDTKLFNSLAEEILKDVKKEMKTDEKLVSFGSKEWNEKYGVKVEEEQTEVSYNSLVNETLKIKKFDDMENLNDVFNKVVEDNKPQRTIDTENK